MVQRYRGYISILPLNLNVYLIKLLLVVGHAAEVGESDGRLKRDARPLGIIAHHTSMTTLEAFRKRDVAGKTDQGLAEFILHCVHVLVVKFLKSFQCQTTKIEEHACDEYTLMVETFAKETFIILI